MLYHMYDNFHSFSPDDIFVRKSILLLNYDWESILLENEIGKLWSVGLCTVDNDLILKSRKYQTHLIGFRTTVTDVFILLPGGNVIQISNTVTSLVLNAVPN